MRVQDTGLARDTVDGSVNKHRRGFNGMSTGQFVSLRIDKDDVIGLNFIPHETAGIQQKVVGVTRQRHAEVIADAFAQAMSRSRPQGQSQVGAERSHGFRVI